MKTPALFNINGYNLFVYHCSRNLYRISIMDESQQTHHFEGIYPNLQAAVIRGKSVIENLKTWKQHTPDCNRTC